MNLRASAGRGAAVVLFSLPMAMGAVPMQAGFVGTIPRDVADLYVGSSHVFNCDIEARYVKPEQCTKDCPLLMHVFLHDRVRDNRAIMSLLVVASSPRVKHGSQRNSTSNALTGTEIVSDVYTSDPRELSYFSKSIRGWDGEIAWLSIASDYLEPFAARWHVICAP